MKGRHELLLETLGEVFDEEEHAYKMVTELSWMLPTIAICGGLLDLLFIGFYMRFAHPWKDIVFGDEVTEKDKKARDDVCLDTMENHEKIIDSKNQSNSYQDQVRYENLDECIFSRKSGA